ncbi:MAG: methylenetetrahydrofolate reductase C-terminal domain-containing protein, partial [Dehalococcoidia bacterium]|nr:methylenetetrahydrofolate reductase C-terminal domain-containing protein [Dehalococcoidia bacterium]
MIKAKHKPIESIGEMAAPYRRVLVLGCNTCTAVSLAGGEKEVGLLSSTLRLRNAGKGKNQEFQEFVVKRQCEMEFLEEARELIQETDVVLSLACGVGMNCVADNFPDTPVLPGNDTAFLGLSPELGQFTERCVACGDCLIHLTGGLCPLARCAKRLLNGPCGGSEEGHCEISPDVPCIWHKIYDRMRALGQLDKLSVVVPVREWSMNDAIG